MKVTFNWLKQYVGFDWSPDQLAERLTLLGLEVEAMHKLAGEFEGVVVAQILTRDQVPGSDKLSVCRVNDGRGERTIICGAQNHKPGDKVALILPNFALPLKPGEKEPFVIKERKVFGIVSQGMMCSPTELGLADDAEGLLILREDARVGQPFAEYLGRIGGDVVYDLEVTPNRPDLNSVLGIAREIAAVTGNPLKMPGVAAGRVTPGAVVSQESGTRMVHPSETVGDLVAVRIEDAALCPRYTARVVRGVKVGPSPDWLRTMLEKVGLRSINNVVDVTNYVLLETGQPLHAFDYRLVANGSGAGASPASVPPTVPVGEAAPSKTPGWTVAAGTAASPAKPTLIIRRARDGELFLTLDGQKRPLTRDLLLIADEQKGIALAGIMGGQNTEINERTADVLIESAYFQPTNIRRTSKALGLRTDASYRFERGADVGIADWASQRCAQLILETAGGQLATGVVDAYPQPVVPKEITLRYAKTNGLLGIEIPPAEQVHHLVSLGLAVVAQTNEGGTFRIPTWRVDLKRETDLIEEIERLHGLDQVPATPPRGAIGAHPFDAVHDQIAEARRLLCGLGLHEAQGQTLVGKAEGRRQNKDLVELANPLSADMDVLRPSLWPGLLTILRHNVSHKNYDVGLFEIGRVFAANHGQPKEERCLALALTGQREAPFWSGGERGAKFDLADLKGLLEEFLEQFGVRGVQYVRRGETTATLLESAAILLGGKLALGELGQLLPALARQHDLRDAVWLAELSLDQLLARRSAAKSFKPLPAFPSVRRDVAMFVPAAVTHDAVLAVVKQARPANLQAVELFDVFRGPHVPAGQKSLAYAFTYRHAERTLTDAEVNAAHARLVAELKRQLGAAVRES